jgi:hypothetical protein
MRSPINPDAASSDEDLFTKGIQQFMFDERTTNEKSVYGEGGESNGRAKIKLEDFKIMKWCDLYPDEKVFPHPLQKHENGKWNSHECGMFTLHYIRCLVFRIPFKFKLKNMELLRNKMCLELLSLGIEAIEIRTSDKDKSRCDSPPLQALTDEEKKDLPPAGVRKLIPRTFLSEAADDDGDNSIKDTPPNQDQNRKRETEAGGNCN